MPPLRCGLRRFGAKAGVLTLWSRSAGVGRVRTAECETCSCVGRVFTSPKTVLNP